MAYPLLEKGCWPGFRYGNGTGTSEEDLEEHLTVEDCETECLARGANGMRTHVAYFWRNDWRLPCRCIYDMDGSIKDVNSYRQWLSKYIQGPCKGQRVSFFRIPAYSWRATIGHGLPPPEAPSLRSPLEPDLLTPPPPHSSSESYTRKNF